MTQAKAGNLKVILVMEEERIKQFPDAPTTKEAGVDFTWSAWKGIIAPKGLPAPVKVKLEGALDKVFQDAKFLKKMDDLGEYIEYRTNAQYKALAERDAAVAEKVIRSLGMYGMNVKK
jgi:tripartite-type tricarboxylate transporter receptor subunit TctC